jgi:hypothetical protein
MRCFAMREQRDSINADAALAQKASSKIFTRSNNDSESISACREAGGR